MALERIYTVPLRKEFMKAPKYKRAKKAVNALKEFLKKHMKSDNVKLGKNLNLEIWKHGIRNPPHHIKVTAIKDDDGLVKAELQGFEYKEMTKEEREKAEKKKKKEKPKEETEEKKEEKEEKTEEEIKTEEKEAPKKEIEEIKEKEPEEKKEVKEEKSIQKKEKPKKNHQRKNNYFISLSTFLKTESRPTKRFLSVTSEVKIFPPIVATQ